MVILSEDSLWFFCFSSVHKVECYVGAEIMTVMSFLFSNIKQIILTC